MKPTIKKLSKNTAVRILERKGVIRLFGLALILSPIINIVFALWVRRLEIHQQYTFSIVMRLILSGSVTHHILTVASLIIGAIMLQGSSKAWKPVLILLGSHILIQIANIGHDLRENWLWGPFFLVNLSIFFFIADQIVFKLRAQKPEVPTLQKPVPEQKINERPMAHLKTKILIHFVDIGPWAELKSVSLDGLHVHCLQDPPAGVENRKIEITFNNGLHIKSHFKNKSDRDFFFEFTTLTPDTQLLLSDWIQKRTA